ncbi:SPOR domain-containing protein [Ancylobacter sp. TS-1]|uniref:SPOR domain-containing protein n=1 Tax=Ancylobacter sp. TS-1 TaxID=1850374 RepID=UPI001265B7D7|nr:SPOR domain-containing protein [Ancylobacter sp. TS-1]QFR32538.1 SPOR domain-containing protein [Ancylobacter sp. TS-1]
MANETMRNRPEVPAEDPLAELARLMGQEDEFANLLRGPAGSAGQAASRRPAAPPQPPAPRAPQPPRPAAPRAPAEGGRPAPGSFAALAAEVYNEGARQSAASRASLDDAAREATRDLARTARPPQQRPPDPRISDPRIPEQRLAEARAPEPRAPEPRAPEARAPEPRAPQERAPQERVPMERAPFVPPRPQPTEPPRRAAAPAPRAPEPERSFDGGVDAVSRALAQSFDPLPEAQRPGAARPGAARAEAPVRQPQARIADDADLPLTDSPPPAWMQRDAAAARAAEAASAPPSARGPGPAPGQPFDPDEESYDYGRSAADYNPADAYDTYEVEEEAPARRGRGRLLLVGGLLLVFVVAAGAGYMLVGGPQGVTRSTGEPPVIRAEQGPNKVVPDQVAKEQGADGQKLIYDRVGGNATTGNEQVVSSEEQPVDMSQAAQPQPRVIQTTPAFSNSSSPTTSGANSAEPKRVRTLTVRADGTIVEDAPPPAPVATAPVQSSAQPTGSAPIPLNPGTGAPVSTNPTPLAATPSIVDNVPSPARVAAAPAAPTAIHTPAPAPAPAPAAAPRPAAATGATAPAGAYVVQIASVRSEAEAQATWRSMQSKYSGLLANQSFGVKRADLGDRGIYYRAQVGSFGSREEAVGLCEALRAQGGDCMVQRN